MITIQVPFSFLLPGIEVEAEVVVPVYLEHKPDDEKGVVYKATLGAPIPNLTPPSLSLSATHEQPAVAVERVLEEFSLVMGT